MSDVRGEAEIGAKKVSFCYVSERLCPERVLDLGTGFLLMDEGDIVEVGLEDQQWSAK